MRCARMVLATIGLLACAATLPAQAQINPFRGGRHKVTASTEDNRMLFGSIARLNAMPSLKPGQSDRWHNPATGSSGVNTVQRIFESGGMPCHRLDHEISLAGRAPTTYAITWCRTPKGEWKSRG